MDMGLGSIDPRYEAVRVEEVNVNSTDDGVVHANMGEDINGAEEGDVLLEEYGSF